MDRRPEELKHMMFMVDFLCETYPEYFRKDEYAHPIKGVRTSLTIISKITTFDIENLMKIEINYDNNFILIKTDKRDIQIMDFIKDPTVM